MSKLKTALVSLAASRTGNWQSANHVAHHQDAFAVQTLQNGTIVVVEHNLGVGSQHPSLSEVVVRYNILGLI